MPVFWSGEGVLGRPRGRERGLGVRSSSFFSAAWSEAKGLRIGFGDKGGFAGGLTGAGGIDFEAWYRVVVDA